MSNGITLILGRDGMGVSEAEDFELWVSFVCKHIDERLGFEIDVDTRNARDVQDDDITGGTDEQRDAIREAKELLWQDWCAWGCADQVHP